MLYLLDMTGIINQCLCFHFYCRFNCSYSEIQNPENIHIFHIRMYLQCKLYILQILLIASLKMCIAAFHGTNIFGNLVILQLKQSFHLYSRLLRNFSV